MTTPDPLEAAIIAFEKWWGDVTDETQQKPTTGEWREALARHVRPLIEEAEKQGAFDGINSFHVYTKEEFDAAVAVALEKERANTLPMLHMARNAVHDHFFHCRNAKWPYQGTLQGLNSELERILNRVPTLDEMWDYQAKEFIKNPDWKPADAE